jgi:hypothetical protein
MDVHMRAAPPGLRGKAADRSIEQWNTLVHARQLKLLLKQDNRSGQERKEGKSHDG